MMVHGYHVYQSVWTPTVGKELPCTFGTGLFQQPPLDSEAQLTETLVFAAASINEDGTILDRGPLGSERFLFTVK